MSNEPRRPYLRLIASSDAPSGKEMGVRRPKQLALPYRDSNRGVLVNADTLTRTEFLGLIEKVNPKWVFDFRAVPRWDLLAGSRSLAFRIFAEHDVNYVDVLGRWDMSPASAAATGPEGWVNIIAELFGKESQVGCVLFVFDDATLMAVANRTLEGALESALGSEVGVSVFRSSSFPDDSSIGSGNLK